MQWVSVNVAMPLDHQFVLFTNGIDVYCGWHDEYLYKYQWSFFDEITQDKIECNGTTDDRITHWMPLPNPPKEE